MADNEQIYFQINHNMDNRVVQVVNNNLIAGDWNGGDNQQWYLVSCEDDPGYVFIYLKSDPTMVLDGNGKDAYPHVYNGGMYQKWNLSTKQTSDGCLIFTQKETGNVLDSDGASIYMNPFNKGKYQHWVLYPQNQEGKKS